MEQQTEQIARVDAQDLEQQTEQIARVYAQDLEQTKMTIIKQGYEIELGCDFCGETYSGSSASQSGNASVHGLVRSSACPATDGGGSGDGSNATNGGFQKARDILKTDAKAAGWRCFKGGGGSGDGLFGPDGGVRKIKWHDSCPSCVSEWADDQRGQRGLF